MIALVIAIFSVWFLVCVLYIFQPKWLGQSKQILHLLGWANNWSMFVHKEKTLIKGSFDVSYQDFIDEHSVSEWITLPKKKWRPTSFIIGLDVSDESILLLLVKGAIRKYLADGNTLTTSNTYFNTLCEVLLTRERQAATASRKVKIQYYPLGEQPTLIIESKAMIQA